ncbi:MAG: TIGR04141 family sporadically distributed protein [Planctomycetes bacterium]|nr:TIGR04141 family sporadically distributed protein [Planctomycetota bacterium]
MAATTRQFTIFLLKADVADPQGALKPDARVTAHAVRQRLPFTGTCFFRDERRNRPGWLPLLIEGVENPPEDLRNASNGAVLVVRSSGRLFAFAFGYGRALLRPDAYERRFGLRVVLNTVDPKRLRSIDSQTFEDLSLQSKRQVSQASGVEEFGLDIERDMLRAVTGQPRDPSLAKVLSGSDALAVTCVAEFKDLAEKCAALLRAYESTDYKAAFEWIDHIEPVTDPDTIRDLDARLLAALNSKRVEHVHLSPPQVIDWERIGGFLLPGMRKGSSEPRPEMEITELLSSRPEPLTREALKSGSIRAIASDSDSVVYEWSIYDCLVFEVRVNPLYVLSAGDWSRIDGGYADGVRKRVEKIPKCRIVLVDAKAGEREGDYNRRAAKSDPNLALMDKQLVRVPGTGTSIEICDLAHKSGSLLHLKRGRASSNLSHLWMQGVMSAEALLADSSVRDAARKKLASKGARFSSVIKKAQDDRSFRVGFGLLVPAGTRVPQDLPFFSQASLAHAHDRLRLLKVRASLRAIDVL